MAPHSQRSEIKEDIPKIQHIDNFGRYCKHIDNFGRYCKVFYQASLSITNNNDDGNDHELCEKREINAAEVIVEALDHCLALSSEDVPADQLQQQEQFLSSSKVKEHSMALASCGLLTLDEMGSKNTPTRLQLPPNDIILKYTEARDYQRRCAHEIEMRQRYEKLESVLQNQEQQVGLGLEIQDQTKENEDTLPTIAKAEASSSRVLSPQNICQMLATRRCNVNNTRMILRRFISQYKNSIGTHSFLAGIRALLQKQLSQDKEKDDSNRIVVWTFGGSILSENSFCTTTISREDCTPREQYMIDAATVLFSFMLRKVDPDVETGTTKDDEDCNQFGGCGSSSSNTDFLSFYINPFVSDSTLQSLLNELPRPNKLDARAAGKLSLLMVGKKTNKNGESSSSIIRSGRMEHPICRMNIDGKLDESLYSQMIYWSEFPCAVL